MAKQGKIIRNGIVYSGGGGGYDIEYLTQSEYDALPESKLTNGVEYRITDSNPPAPTAKDMSYDNSESGIEAENVQDAIDEVKDNVNTLNESLDTISNVTVTAQNGSTINGYAKINNKLVDLHLRIVLSGTITISKVIAKVAKPPIGEMYRIPCIYRNSGSGAITWGSVSITTAGNIASERTDSNYNEIDINCTYLTNL